MERITWQVYGITYTGTLVKRFDEDGRFFKKGDMLVRPDNPDFEGQTVIVTEKFQTKPE